MLDSEPAQPVQLLQLLVRILVNIVVMHHEEVAVYKVQLDRLQKRQTEVLERHWRC